MATLITSRPDSVGRHLNPLTLARALWRHRELVYQFTRRDIEGRYRGSFLGLLWSFINPLVTLFIYTFAFGVVVKTRWPQARTDSLGEFAVVLLCGVATFGVFTETLNRASTAIIGVPNYVKKVVFPLEILPVSLLGTSLFHFLINLGILTVASVLVNGTLIWTIVLVPVVLLPLLFVTLGMAWFLASLGVFIRDISYSVGLVTQVLFFLTPTLYPLDAIPEPFKTIVLFNPLTPIVQSFRDVILWGVVPDLVNLAVWLFISGVIMVLGYAWFMKTKKAFADVI